VDALAASVGNRASQASVDALAASVGNLAATLAVIQAELAKQNPK
jgi:hypothetical protein